VELEVLETAVDAAGRAAAILRERAAAGRAERGRAVVALSGGTSPFPMFDALSREPFDWSGVTLAQVDERIAPSGSSSRNATHLEHHLVDRVAGLRDRYVPMPVDADDLGEAAGAYERTLHERCGGAGVIDVVHLGLGTDGHTASLAPGDPILDVRDRDVWLTGMYSGFRRMTLTYAALERSAFLLWLVVGEEKHEMLERLLAGDRSIPAGRLAGGEGTVVADRAAVTGSGG
jgi:6-phosphogluconolactonase